MPDVYGRRKRIDDAVESAVRGERKPAPAPKKDAKAEAEARVRRGRSRASDARIHGDVDLAKKAAKDLMQGTMQLNRLRKAQHTDSNN